MILSKYQNLYEAKGENDYIKDKMNMMRENIVMFTDKYDVLQENISSIKDLIENLNSKAKFRMN